MPQFLDPALVCAGLVLFNGLAALFLYGRQHEAFVRREAETREAVALLDLHVSTLEMLDDDAVPVSLAQFAWDVSDLLHDADRRVETLMVARQRASAAREAPRTRGPLKPRTALRADEIARDLTTLQSSRPELASAFAQTILAGIMSFERMFPDCAGAIGLDVAKLVASPVDEAERVVRRARDMRRDWQAGEAMPAAA